MVQNLHKERTNLKWDEIELKVMADFLANLFKVQA
jgi:hypothetical protein